MGTQDNRRFEPATATATRVERFHYASFDRKEETPKAAEPAPETAVPAEPEAPPAPTFSQEQIDKSAADAHAHGYGEGMKAAEAKADAERPVPGQRRAVAA